jgi:hypothetical protein
MDVLYFIVAGVSSGLVIAFFNMLLYRQSIKRAENRTKWCDEFSHMIGVNQAAFFNDEDPKFTAEDFQDHYEERP